MSNRREGGYCADCDAPRDISQSILWQDDACRRCGSTAIEYPGDPATDQPPSGSDRPVSVEYPADHPSLPARLLASRYLAGTGLLALLVVAVLSQAAGGPEWLTSWIVASVALAVAGVLMFVRYWDAVTADDTTTRYLVGAQLVLTAGLLRVLYQSQAPSIGLGVHRELETAAICLALIALCVLAGDPRRHDAFQWLVLGCFAAVVGIFFYHSLPVAEGSVRSRHPLWWGTVAGVCLAVLPAYVSREAFLWAINRLAAAAVLVALPVYVLGEYSLFGLQVRFHGEYTIPLLDAEVQATRSAFVNRNAFGLVVFAGLIAAIGELHRAITTERRFPLLAIAVAIAFLGINALGVAIAYVRALWVITPIALGLFGAYLVVGRWSIPLALTAGVAYLAGGIAAIHTGMIELPGDPPTRASRWYPTISAIVERPSLLGEGLIPTAQFMSEFHPDWTGTPHNSYLSIWIRTGIIGGVAYLGIVCLSVLRGLWRYRDVDVAVLALAVGFGFHQLFEAYTLFQTGIGSVLAALAIGMLAFGGRSDELMQRTDAVIPGETSAPSDDAVSETADGHG